MLVYLADLQQRVPIQFSGARGPARDEHADTIEVDTTLAGQAFQRGGVLTQPLDDGSSRTRAWLPLLDGNIRRSWSD